MQNSRLLKDMEQISKSVEAMGMASNSLQKVYELQVLRRKHCDETWGKAERLERSRERKMKREQRIREQQEAEEFLAFIKNPKVTIFPQ